MTNDERRTTKTSVGRWSLVGSQRSSVRFRTWMLYIGFLALVGWAFGARNADAKRRAICGTLLLEHQRTRASVQLKPMGPAIRTARQPSIGQSMDFSVYSFLTGTYYVTTAVCRHIGEHSYVFVENEQWGTRVHQEDVDALARTFDRSTARHPDRGIFGLEVETFGAPPDIDRDPRIYLLVMDIEDGALSDTDYVAGFFDSRDLGIEGNAREILYLDCHPLSIRSGLAMATLAHEFQHLIHYGYDDAEKPWINEGCSGYAEAVCGYAEGYGTAFLAEPDNSLTYFGQLGTDADYDKTFLFITYLAERFGGSETIRTLVSRPEHGIVGVDRALEAVGRTERFEEVFAEWTVANYLRDAEGYGYRSVELKRIATSQERTLPVESSALQVQPWAADYVEFMTGEDMTLHFNGDGLIPFRVRLVSKREGQASVTELFLDDHNDGDMYVEGADTVAMIIARAAPAVGRYAYSASKLIPTAVSPPGRLVDRATVYYGAEDAAGSWSLGPNSPNPFNASTQIFLRIGAPTRVTVDLFDISGRRIRTVMDGSLPAGGHTIRWDGTTDDGRRASSGVYLVRMRAGRKVFTRRIMLIR